MHRYRMTICAALLGGCAGSGREIAPIRLEPVVTLGATSGDGAIATTPTVSALHPGGFRVVVPAHSAIGGLPLVFSEQGEYRGNLRGDDSLDGAMYSRFGPGDSVWVFDNSGRVQLFSPTLQFVRHVQLPVAPNDAIVLGDNRFLVMTPAGTMELEESTGVVVREIAAADTVPATRRFLIPGARGTFWTITTAGDWQLQHWDTGGTRLSGVTFRPEWLGAAAGGRSDSSARGAQAPAAAIAASWIDAAGRLWIVAEVADRNWREALGTPDLAGSATITDDDKYYDTIVEVRDTTRGEVLATTRFDKRFLAAAGPGVLVHVVHTSAGWQQAELGRVIWDGGASRP